MTPNVNTVYGFGFLDLSQEPIVIAAPDSGGRYYYYMIELIDMWNNAFAYPADNKVGYRGGKFAVVGPGWKGELPKELKCSDAPTRWVAVQPRCEGSSRPPGFAKGSGGHHRPGFAPMPGQARSQALDLQVRDTPVGA